MGCLDVSWNRFVNVLAKPEKALCGTSGATEVALPLFTQARYCLLRNRDKRCLGSCYTLVVALARFIPLTDCGTRAGAYTATSITPTYTLIRSAKSGWRLSNHWLNSGTCPSLFGLNMNWSTFFERWRFVRNSVASSAIPCDLRQPPCWREKADSTHSPLPCFTAGIRSTRPSDRSLKPPH